MVTVGAVYDRPRCRGFEIVGRSQTASTEIPAHLN